MKLVLALFLALPFLNLGAAEKDEQIIAKGIQCTYLREKSFLDICERYSFEKINTEYLKQVSDSIYSQAFKICDPENIVNADKDIFKACSTGCEQFATKGVLGLGGPSKSDIEHCKKMCLNYSDHLGNNYVAATKSLKKYIEQNPSAPIAPKKVEILESPTPTAPATPATTPPATTSAGASTSEPAKE